jgi:ribosome-binding ATPase
MQTGIIGLGQTGKTTLFRILTGARVEAKAQPGQTHVGIARVPDARLLKLAELFQPKKLTYATVEYVDVGGLTAAKQKDRANPAAAGRDSASLVPLREADALMHVVRLFEDASMPYPAGSLDALRDIESVEIELMLNDLEQATKRLERVEKDLKKKRDPQAEMEKSLLERCVKSLESEKPLRELDFKPDEQKMMNGFMFVSRKPMLVALNLADEDAADMQAAVARLNLSKLEGKARTAIVPFCGKVEAELADLNPTEAAELMSAYGLREPGRDRILRATYDLLGLISFLTCGEPECRAWTIPRGISAAKAAGAIHSDIEQHFIKAEVVNWQDLLAAGSWAAAREKAKVRLEGKEYIVEDGDVILFRHSG